MVNIEHLERERLAIQARLDAEKTQAERNRMGQFATPTLLAQDILRYASSAHSIATPVRFLDPAFGTGSFYSALLQTFGEDNVGEAVGFEIDPHYAKPAQGLWLGSGIDIRVGDFARATPPENDFEKPNLIVCNPPYVRHHHIPTDEKKRLQELVARLCRVSLSGLSGLYCYFMCLSSIWMAPNGLAAWLIPSEFMDVNYGTPLKKFLLEKVTLLHIHRFSPSDVQFHDALVSSAIVWVVNATPLTTHQVRFTLGGTLDEPSHDASYPIDQLREVKKWTALPRCEKTTRVPRSVKSNSPLLGDFFDVKRGVATGANKFFILTPAEVRRREIPMEFLTPILPSPRYLGHDRIDPGSDGLPAVERLGFLFSSALPEHRIKREFPDVWRYLEEGRELGIPEGYICRNRTPWYQQEYRAIPTILCTYMARASGDGRDSLFRFILNNSNAIAANVYLMLYPKPDVKREIQTNPKLAESAWKILRDIPADTLRGEGRVYGGGLYKLEPKELLNVPAESFVDLFGHNFERKDAQLSLF